LLVKLSGVLTCGKKLEPRAWLIRVN